MGHWQWKEAKRRRVSELDAELDRREIRKVAEDAASDAAACAAVIDRFAPAPKPPLRIARAYRSGVRSKECPHGDRRSVVPLEKGQ
jgi:hypothetical protein